MKKKRERTLFCIILLIGLIDSVLIKAISNTDLIFPWGEKKTAITSELEYFPLAVDRNATQVCHYENSWGNTRTYGGNRRHEGTDLMTIQNKRGIYPIVSMTDGTLEQIGWLKLGGWRIGIRSASGIYYYYAHLESYAADLAEGATIYAGQFLGFAGDSGYGKEGTTGQFDVHLHIGIYIPVNGDDQAVNPYPYLKRLERNKLYARYLP